MALLSDLQAIVGADSAAQTSDEIVVAPGTTEEVSGALRVCSEHRATVTPSGGGTKLSWGNSIKTQVRLSTGRLAGVREHVWQDMTATVGAGTLWANMQDAFSKHGQQVALDPCFPTAATVGGTLAVNESGALRVKYGSLRDLVIGTTVVLSDGTIARSGGKVVKNVAGYDLPKLLIGSFGTLGVITEVNFRLHPLESHQQSWTIRGHASQLGQLMQRLKAAGTSMQSLQMRNERQDLAVDVRFASAPTALQHDAERLRAMCTGLELAEADESIWNWRNELLTDPEQAVLKVTCLPTQLEPIVSGFSKAAVRVRCAAEAVGIITVQMSGEPELMAPLIDDLRARLRASGGMVVVLQWPFASPSVERWAGSPPAIAIMRSLKEHFDPDRLLNPGKFVGGI